MTTESLYLHVLDGRLRLKVPEVKNAPVQARQLEQTLAIVPGITTIQANPRTGNVLILFEPAILRPEAIVALLRVRGYCRRAPASSPHLGQRVVTSILNSAVEATIERLVLALI